MKTEPKIEQRSEQPYLAIKAEVRMEEIPTKLPELIPEMYNWLQNHNIEPAGPVFFNYLDMQNGVMQAEVGIPVKTVETGDGRVHAGSFPAGKYAVYTHMGNYNEIPQAHKALANWAKENDIKLQDPCMEFYPTDPETEPNPAKWQTDILRRISG